MKKTVLLITFCLSVSIVKAGEYDDEIFPWIKYISSNDSIVWLLVDKFGGDLIIYRIDFDKFGSIHCSEEKDYSLCINLKSQYHNYCNWQKYKHPSDVRKEDFDESGRFWEVKGKYLSVTGEDDWDNVYMMPYSECVLHVRKEKGEIWVGGIHCFVAYYNRGAVLQIFFKDQYELMGTRIGLLTEKEDCPEEEIQLASEDGIVYEVFRYGYHDPNIMSVVSDDSICFCDGRKIGYINDNDGFVDFRTKPNISASVIGIILNQVRIFYWDNENNGEWYRVEINNKEGYVHKSRIKPTRRMIGEDDEL